MIIPVWGMDYVERWLALSFASLRSAGNIGYVNDLCELELVIVTKSSDATLMRADARFAKMMEGLRVKFLSLDEFFPPREKVSYGMPLTLAYAKAINDLGSEGLGSYIIMVNADFILSSGSLKSVVDRIKQGFAIITAPSIRVIDADVRPMLLGCVDREAGVISMSSREMMRIVNAHLHNTVTARTVNGRSYVDSNYYHQIYWRVSADCVAARYFLLMPLCFRVDRLMEKVVCPVDYGFITEFCPDGPFTALTDSDDFLMLELQERDSEARLLRIARKMSTLDERLAVLEQEISSQAGGWATREHRRSITQTLYFHERDLPADIADRMALFNAFMTRLLARMPPPVPHIRHFHWLGAVRDYRQRMIRGGAGAVVEPLEDPRNGARPTLEELGNPNAWSGGPIRRMVRFLMQEVMMRSARLRGWGRRVGEKVRCATPRSRLAVRIAAKFRSLERAMTRRLLVRRPRRKLAATLATPLAAVDGRSAVAYLLDTDAYAPPPPEHASILSVPVSYVLPSEGGFRLRFASRTSVENLGTFLLYMPLSFVLDWPRIADDIDQILQTYRQAIIVLMLPYYESSSLAEYAWLLPVLLRFFGSPDFDITLHTFAGQPALDPLRVLLGLLSPHSWINAPRRLGRILGSLLRHALSYQSTNVDEGPKRFAGLIIRATRSSDVRSEPRSTQAAF